MNKLNLEQMLTSPDQTLVNDIYELSHALDLLLSEATHKRKLDV